MNNQIAISEKKLLKSKNVLKLILSNHLENIPKIIPNKKINKVLINFLLNFKLSSTLLILFKNFFNDITFYIISFFY